jgi:L-alanine-DL-glutamate epimerase-like enolase superfamily enzyme
MVELGIDQLVADAKTLLDSGYRGIKMKVGTDRALEDLRRVQAVREAIGPNIDLMADANGRWLFPDAFDFCRRVADFHLKWLEEPIWYDDVEGHRQLAMRCGVPIALGEQLYAVDHFKQFLAAGAVDFVQPDAVRLATYHRMADGSGSCVCLPAARGSTYWRYGPGAPAPRDSTPVLRFA